MHGIGTIGFLVIVIVVAFLILPTLGLSGILVVIGVLALLKGHLIAGIACIGIGVYIKPRRY
ncbi:hypothetical protein BH11CYA1_BH11CYA1_07900 [soil metagenome]